MSEIEPVVEAPYPRVRADPAVLAVASARAKLTNFLPRAIQILTELAETSENDRVRLAAVESIADRVGLGRSSTTQLQVNSGEHEAVEAETNELLIRMQRNQAVIQAEARNTPLDVLLVLESDEVLADS